MLGCFDLISLRYPNSQTGPRMTLRLCGDRVGYKTRGGPKGPTNELIENA